jgi:hypothetical protein
LALRRHRRPRRRGDAPAHDPETTHEAVLEVDHVHRPRAAAADPGGAAEHLGRERLRIGALRQGMPVAAVGAGHVVVRLERRAYAHRDGLLPGGQVRRAVHLALQEQALDLLLEPANEAHPAVAIEVLRGRLAGLVLPLAGALGLCPRHRSHCIAIVCID